MTNFYYDAAYPQNLADDLRLLAERDPSYLQRLNEGPRTSGQLELQLAVTPQQRLNVVFKHAAQLASEEPAVVLAAAKALTADLEYLNVKTRAHRLCQSIRPPIFRAPATR